jgi:hypothetical protein
MKGFTMMSSSSSTLFTAVLGLGVVAAATPAFASQLVVNPTNDAMIFATSAGVDTTNASGKGPGMFAGADGNGDIKRSLVKFDVSSIPTTATVSSIELDLVIGQIAGSGHGCGTMCNPPSRTFDIYEVDYTTSWSEGLTGDTACPVNVWTGLCAAMSGTGQGWAYQTTCRGAGHDADCGGDVSYEYIDYTSTTKWQNYTAHDDQDYGDGGFGAPNYGNHTAAGTWTFNSFTIGNTEAFTGNTTTNNPNFTAIVQDWVTHPTHNNGFEIRGPALESVKTSFIGWWTKDGATANSNNALKPVLTVNY